MQILDDIHVKLDPIKSVEYRHLRGNGNRVVVHPLFTEAAYSTMGFYCHYAGNCGTECLTISFVDAKMGYTSSGMVTQVLYELGYDMITDAELDLNPSILEQYDTVILLHNEYITNAMYDAIIAHPRIIHMYSNSVFSEISVDYDSETVTLVRDFRLKDIDRTPYINNKNTYDYHPEVDYKYEYDAECADWKWELVYNGYHLTCYPDPVIWHMTGILDEMVKIISELDQ